MIKLLQKNNHSPEQAYMKNQHALHEKAVVAKELLSCIIKTVFILCSMYIIVFVSLYGCDFGDRETLKYD